MEETNLPVEGGACSIIGCLCIPYVVISVGIMVLCFYSCQEKPKVLGEDQSGAYWITKEFVKKRLKAPSTAEFADFSASTVVHQGDGIYSVRSYVDSENSFGAKIRIKFSAKVQEKENEKWELLNLEFHEF